MANQNQTLNDLLIDLCRSLLQYTDEAWPWSADNDQQARNTVTQIVARQHVYIAEISELLMSRGWNIDFGMYPAAYTDLHYVALDYLMSLLVENQAALLGEIEAAIPAVQGNREATALLTSLAGEQREAVRALRQLLESQPRPGARV